MSEWISVKDRLPGPEREGKSVSDLVVAFAGQPEIAYYSSASGWWLGAIELLDVTHWMPLPPDPKDES